MKKKEDILLEKHIFPVDVTAIYGPGMFGIYSPFADKIIILSNSQWDEILQANDFLQKIESLFPSFEISEREIAHGMTECDLVRMSVIPTHRCNFHCQYCYAAQGRSDEVMPFKIAETALDYFINHNRTKRNDLYISIVGGGEPLVTWDTTKKIIKRIRKLEETRGFNVSVTMTTNGSLVNANVADFLVAYGVKVCVSFEIIKHFQELHRGHYEAVRNGILQLCKKGCDVSIRTTITPQCVLRQTEMVEEIKNSYPQIRKMNFDYVVSNEIFSTAKKLTDFFTNFTECFFKASKKANELNLVLSTPLFRKTKSLCDRYCSGDFCITPSGAISICHRFTSPAEPHYCDCIYGQINQRNVKIDRAYFRELMNCDVYKLSKCYSCFARFHCGGHCLAHRFNYTDEQLDAVCSFTRDFVLRSLLTREFQDFL